MTEKPRETQAESHVVELKEKVNNSSLMKHREATTVSASTVAESSGHVSFSDDDLVAIGVDPADLNPFVFQGEHAELLVGQSIGHTALERRPLVRFRGRMTVVLPTAVGAAIRRFVVECASTEGDLRLFQSTCHLAQFTEVFLLGRADWNIEYMRMLEPDPDDGIREFVGAFDDDAYVHLLLFPMISKSSPGRDLQAFASSRTRCGAESKTGRLSLHGSGIAGED